MIKVQIKNQDSNLCVCTYEIIQIQLNSYLFFQQDTLRRKKREFSLRAIKTLWKQYL